LARLGPGRVAIFASAVALCFIGWWSIAAGRARTVKVEFVEETNCQALPAHAMRFCNEARHSKNPKERGTFAYAWIDADGDGDNDLVVRRTSLFACGSHGCATDVLLRQGRQYFDARPPLVTDGAVETCRDKRGAGLLFRQPRPPGACIHFRVRT
jgi:hypothetical protein